MARKNLGGELACCVSVYIATFYSFCKVDFYLIRFGERGGGGVVSPASLLDSQHRCIASPHMKESGQTLLAVWSPLVQEFLGPESGFDCCGVWFYSSLLTVRPHLLTVQDQTAYGV